jgi:hypothetical protein
MQEQPEEAETAATKDRQLQTVIRLKLGYKKYFGGEKS